jgi:hypothetical protein
MSSGIIMLNTFNLQILNEVITTKITYLVTGNIGKNIGNGYETLK